MKCGNHIGFEEVPQFAQLHLLERTGERVTGAVDQNVDTAMLGVDLLNESIHGGLIGDVERTGL